jgi:hypothetical protein
MATRSTLPVWVEPALHEYDALRAEVTTSLQTQHATLAFGSATLGLVAAGGFQLVDRDPTSLALIFVVAVPLISLLIVTIWLGELARMMRAGRHLQLLEYQLKSNISGAPAPVFAWEAGLQRATAYCPSWLERQYQFSYHSVVFLFALIAVVSVAFGMYQVSWSSGWWIVAIAELVAVTGGAAVLMVAVKKACAPRSPAPEPTGSPSSQPKPGDQRA